MGAVETGKRKDCMEDSDLGVFPTTISPTEQGVRKDRQVWGQGWGQSSGMGWFGKEHVDCGEFLGEVGSLGEKGEVWPETQGFRAKLMFLRYNVAFLGKKYPFSG